jgi:hypothetical protein
MPVVVVVILFDMLPLYSLLLIAILDSLHCCCYGIHCCYSYVVCVSLPDLLSVERCCTTFTFDGVVVVTTHSIRYSVVHGVIYVFRCSLRCRCICLVRLPLLPRDTLLLPV